MSLFSDAACFIQVVGMLEHGLGKLSEKVLHVALAAWEQALQEGNVSSVSGHQQRHIREALDNRNREGCQNKKLYV